MYFDIREKLDSNNIDEDNLIKAIETIDTTKAIEITRKFRKEFVEQSGNASKMSVDIIWNYLNKNPY